MMAPMWSAGPKHRRRDPLWMVVLVVIVAAAIGTGLGYVWPDCTNAGAAWWCW